MKRILYFFGATLVAALCALSCSQEIEGDGLDTREKARQQLSSQEILITATAPDAEPETKTARFDTKFYWAVGDKISIFYGPGDQGGSCFTSTHTIQDGDDGHEGYVRRTTFRGYIDVITGLTEGSDDIKFWGIFPYRSDNACVDNGAAVVTTIPNTQSTDYGSWGNSQSVCIGRSNGLVMGFYNLCGGIMFKLSQDRTLSQITFRGNNNETVAGQVKVVMDSKNEPVISEFITQQKEITLYAPNDFNTNGDVWYYLIIPPCTFSKGFTMTLYDNNGQYAEFVESRSRTVKRNVFGKYGTAIDDGLTFTDLPPANNQLIYYYDIQFPLSYPNFGDLNYTIEEPVYGKIKLTFDEALTEIPAGAFQNMTELTGIILPEGLQYINSNAFEGCKRLTDVEIPSTVQSIRSSAFKDCISLESIHIPKLSGIGSINPFAGCTNLKSFSGPDASADGKFLGFHLDEPERAYLASCAIGAFKNQECVLPEVAEIAREACYAAGFNSVVIPGTVTTIDQEAFAYSCISTPLTIPGSVTAIGKQAFYGCDSLFVITLERPSFDGWGSGDYAWPGFPTLGSQAFPQLTLTTINIPGYYALNLDESGSWYDYKDKMVAYQADNEIWHNEDASGASSFLPNDDSILDIDGNVNPPLAVGSIYPSGTTFSSKLPVVPSVNLPSEFHTTPVVVEVYQQDIHGIGASAFYSDKAAQKLYISLPHTVEYINDDAFRGDAALLVFPSDGLNLEYIGKRAFRGCTSMAGEVYAPCVYSAGTSAFENCSSITGVTMMVRLLQPKTFRNCTSLVWVVMPDYFPVAVGAQAFENCKALKTVAYKQSYTGVRIIGEMIQSSAFAGCSSLKKVQLELTSAMGTGAFAYCTKLTTVQIAGDLETIPDHAFEGCTVLQTVTLNAASLTTIETSAFSGDIALVKVGGSDISTGVLLPAVTSVGTQAFSNTAIQSVSLPAATSLGASAFSNCGSLSNVNLPNVTIIPTNCFLNCSGLSGQVNIPSAQTIQEMAFYGCTTLSELILPDVTLIGDKAFGLTRSLTNLEFGSGLTTLGAMIFYDESTDNTVRNYDKLEITFSGPYPTSLYSAWDGVTPTFCYTDNMQNPFMPKKVYVPEDYYSNYRDNLRDDWDQWICEHRLQMYRPD